MRRESLESKKQVRHWPVAATPSAEGGDTAALDADTAHALEPLIEALDSPQAARERRRLFFDPRAGWFRRLERAVSHALSCHLFPRVPGMRWPYSRQLERELTLSEVELAIPDLAIDVGAIRVLLLTDLHAGPFLQPAALDRAVARLMESEPDLVLVGGDFLAGAMNEFADLTPALARLQAPLGVFGVLGNHDHYAGSPTELRRMLAACGVEILHNRWTRVRCGAASLTLAGIDDLLVGEPDLDAALDGAEGPIVLLSHNPDIFFAAARRGVPLVLAGHTHAGQVRMPGLPVIVRQSRYRLDEGHYRFGDSQLVVSRGLGASGLPLRLHCPPEAVLLTLRPDVHPGLARLQQL